MKDTKILIVAMASISSLMLMTATVAIIPIAIAYTDPKHTSGEVQNVATSEQYGRMPSSTTQNSPNA
jgi:hypothetical protein